MKYVFAVFGVLVILCTSFFCGIALGDYIHPFMLICVIFAIDAICFSTEKLRSLLNLVAVVVLSLAFICGYCLGYVAPGIGFHP